MSAVEIEPGLRVEVVDSNGEPLPEDLMQAALNNYRQRERDRSERLQVTLNALWAQSVFHLKRSVERRS